MSAPNSKSELLLSFELREIPEHYRPYYEIKRNNFFASIQGSPDLWRYSQLLDRILLSEFQDMGTAHDPNRMFPLALYFNAHAKIRISMELAFTKCMEEARSILRDAIETAVFAHYMHDDPNLQKIWFCKDDSPQAGRDFSLAFEKDKKTKLFKGLTELHRNWGRLSETGSHSTPQAIVSRFTITETGRDIHYQMNYSGVEDRQWEPETFTLLLTVSMLEKLVFGDYEARLQFDPELVRNRGLAEQMKEKLRRYIIKRHNISPPSAKP